jgi:hypothetical protein
MTNFYDSLNGNLDRIKFIKRTPENRCWSSVIYLINRKGMTKILNNCIKTNHIYLKPNNEKSSSLGVSDDFFYAMTNTYFTVPCFFISSSACTSDIKGEDIIIQHSRNNMLILSYLQKFYNTEKAGFADCLLTLHDIFRSSFYIQKDILGNINWNIFPNEILIGICRNDFTEDLQNKLLDDFTIQKTPNNIILQHKNTGIVVKVAFDIGEEYDYDMKYLSLFNKTFNYF